MIDSLDTSKCSCEGCNGTGTVSVPITYQFQLGTYCETCAEHIQGHGREVHAQSGPGLGLNQGSFGSVDEKKLYCLFGCNTEIFFDKSKVSASGKMIPLNSDRTLHNCSNNPYNLSPTKTENGKTYFCHHCGREITFSNSMKTQDGKSIPLNLDKSQHNCPNRPVKVF